MTGYESTLEVLRRGIQTVFEERSIDKARVRNDLIVLLADIAVKVAFLIETEILDADEADGAKDA